MQKLQQWVSFEHHNKGRDQSFSKEWIKHIYLQYLPFHILIVLFLPSSSITKEK
jgi:hypothetical protein